MGEHNLQNEKNLPIGEATVQIFDFNRPEDIVVREKLARVGEYP